MSKTQLQTNNAKLSALITELQGKAAGGDGSSGGTTLKTCQLIVTDTDGLYAIAYTTVDSNGNIAYEVLTTTSSTETITCLCNSTVAISHRNESASECYMCELLYSGEGYQGVFDNIPGHSYIGLKCGSGETARFYTTSYQGGSTV